MTARLCYSGQLSEGDLGQIIAENSNLRHFYMVLQEVEYGS